MSVALHRPPGTDIVEHMEDKKAFNKDEPVPEPGEYVCVPCGYHKVYQSGDKFSECISCLSGTNDGEDEFAEGLEMWEKAQPHPVDEDASIKP